MKTLVLFPAAVLAAASAVVLGALLLVALVTAAVLVVAAILPLGAFDFAVGAMGPGKEGGE
ncbi:MAG: hypothetical protein R3A48_28735 [Polyangiales bacterium]